MSDRHPLDAFTGPLRTRVGGVVPGERAVFRGRDLHRDLPNIHWVELLLFAVTGRRFSPGEVRVCNALFTFTSYPDTRIWNNRVAALAGTARSTGNLAVSAALSASEATLFGSQVCYRCLDFLMRARDCGDEEGDLEVFVADYLARYRSVGGFGRPLTEQDERILPMLALLAEEGLDNGPFLRLARQVEAILRAGRWRYRMNYAGLAAAVYGDLGLTPEQCYLVTFPAFIAGMTPCYLEARAKPSGAIMPIPCGAINYNGSPPRRWTQ